MGKVKRLRLHICLVHQNSIGVVFTWFQLHRADYARRLLTRPFLERHAKEQFWIELAFRGAALESEPATLEEV